MTHFIVGRVEGDNGRSETGGRGMPYLQSELAALDISHSAFCVHSIVSALIITHARARFPPLASLPRPLPSSSLQKMAKSHAALLLHLCATRGGLMSRAPCMRSCVACMRFPLVKLIRCNIATQHSLRRLQHCYHNVI